jgi:antitoxin MazE
MKVQVKKWGNSASVRIPASVHGRRGGQPQSGRRRPRGGGRIIIEPIRQPTYDLDQLLDQMSPDTFHDDVDVGPPVGREAW